MDAQIEIYNMYGIKQNNPEISIEKQADYKANIVWNCSGYSAGVYFIRITLGGETMAVPVLINQRELKKQGGKIIGRHQLRVLFFLVSSKPVFVLFSSLFIHFSYFVKFLIKIYL